ncbi:MAG: flippase [Candidatus Methanofastidiosa archaeon]|nr:flippase [Candidatus Methanofastidiosa archaeon]
MYRKSTYLFIVNSINRVLNFLLRIVLRAVLGVEGFGTIAVILPIQNLILTITSYAISPSVSKYVSEDEAKGGLRDLYPFLFIPLGLVLFLLGYLMAPSFASFLSEDFGQEIVTPLRVMFLGIPFGVIFSIFSGIFFGKQLARKVAYSLLIVQASTIVLAYLMGLSMGVSGAVLSFFLAYVVGTFFLLTPVARQMAKWSVDWGRGRQMIRFSLPILVTSLAIVSIFQVDIVVLGRYYTTYETSLYGLVTPTARLIPAFSIALSTMLLPKLSSLKVNNFHDEIERTLSKAFDVGFTVSLPFSLLIFSFSREILFVLFDSTEATRSLMILSIGMLFYSLYYLLSSSLQGLGKPRVPMYILSFCALLDVALCFALIPGSSIDGAATATAISMGVAFILVFLYIRPKKMPRLANVLSVIPLIAFERMVGVLDGKATTFAVYMSVGLIYLFLYNRYNGTLDVLRNE